MITSTDSHLKLLHSCFHTMPTKTIQIVPPIWHKHRMPYQLLKDQLTLQISQYTETHFSTETVKPEHLVMPKAEMLA